MTAACAEKKIHNNYFTVMRSIIRGGLGRLALVRWAGWSAGQVGHNVKCRTREWNGVKGPEA